MKGALPPKDSGPRKRSVDIEMDPRTLIAPTVTVFLIIASVAAALYYAGEPKVDPQEELEEVDLHSRSSVKSYLSKKFAEESKKNIIVYGMIAAFIYFCPVNLTDGMSNRILKILIGAFLCLINHFVSGRAELNPVIMMRLLVIGGILMGVIMTVRSIKRRRPNDKRPCHMRWSGQRRMMEPDTDPETLAKLDRWRDIAAGVEPMKNLPEPGYES